MKSNVCKINNGISDLSDILNESAKVAVYNDFDQKQSLQLRLICEEIDGMLPNIIDEFEGDFWIECEDDICKVNVSIKIPEFNVLKKVDLPEPDGPIIITFSPLSTLRFIPFKTSFPSKLLHIFFTSSIFLISFHKI